MITFKEWLKLKENGTSTADVAVFARPVFSGNVSPALEKKKKKPKIR